VKIEFVFFCAVAPRSVVAWCQRSGGSILPSSLLIPCLFNLENGGSTVFRNVVIQPPHNTISKPFSLYCIILLSVIVIDPILNSLTTVYDLKVVTDRTKEVYMNVTRNKSHKQSYNGRILHYKKIHDLELWRRLNSVKFSRAISCVRWSRWSSKRRFHCKKDLSSESCWLRTPY
jgi:hypothetical protein